MKRRAIPAISLALVVLFSASFLLALPGAVSMPASAVTQAEIDALKESAGELEQQQKEIQAQLNAIAADKDEAINDLCRLYERMVMRRHTNGGHDHVLGELWRQCENFNANVVIMYQHVCCKTMAGLQGLFDDQARELGIHLIWVEHDLMDPRTVSRKDMRGRVNNYMVNVMHAEPVDPTLIDIDDEVTW